MACPYSQKAAAAAALEATEAEPKKCPYASKQVAEVVSEKPAEAPKKCPYASKQPEVVEEPKKCPYASKQSTDADFTKFDDAAYKEHFRSAYNNVAVNTASRQGNQEVATVLMARLGYTVEDLAVIGSDAWLMQGTGNPHNLAAIRPGETVVDLGSGFGMDAFVAASRAGPQGRVVGIDLSEGEVTAALKRVQQRKLRNVDFRIGDIEEQPFEDGFADCVISNGGFCLVPNKPKAFGEIFRVLKPGGRMSVSCTTLLQELDPSIDWPSCMRVFMSLSKAEEILTSIGFVGVEIDQSNARMDVWEKVKEEVPKAEVASTRSQPPQEAATKADSEKVTIHRGDPRYEHLKQFDMSSLCARVNIFARKPAL